jgi:hypothetical protein
MIKQRLITIVKVANECKSSDRKMIWVYQKYILEGDAVFGLEKICDRTSLA